ncbi:hypothetical protein B4168_1317 [Anoxybacillus flavithermus]|nr:hypothetical protein B4168_1317 [Anoxybacillus flavithermus]OAO83650.1 hypothetical protein GT23_4144 [Parageobacillus thermoglucosidasius]
MVLLYMLGGGDGKNMMLKSNLAFVLSFPARRGWKEYDVKE